MNRIGKIIGYILVELGFTAIALGMLVAVATIPY